MDDTIGEGAKSPSAPGPDKEPIVFENASEQEYQAQPVTKPLTSETSETAPSRAITSNSNSEQVLEPEAIRTFVPSEKVTPKIADRPHSWTVGLGIVAIVISLLSYLESHRALQLSTGIARAAVQVSSVTWGIHFSRSGTSC